MRRRCDLFRWFAATFAATSLLSVPFSVGENSSALSFGAPALDPRLDMMATLLAPGPHPSLGAEARTFDRVVGTWDADYSFHAEDGSVTHAKGEVRFGWILDGHALEDMFISYPKQPTDERKIVAGVRFFDAKAGVWRLVFVAPTFGVISTLEGGAEGDRIVLRGKDSDGSSLRWSFNEIQANSFIWRGEISRDGGKTWRLEEEHHMKRRTGTPAPNPPRDLMTALPAPGPHPSLGAEAHTFDRLVGAWDADCSFHPENGSISHSKGEVRFGWVLDGHALQDTWIGYPGRPTDERGIGTTLRFFDAKANVWRMVFVAPAFDVVTMLEGGAQGDRVVFGGKDSNGSSLRWSFNDIQTDSFTWRGEISHDGGKTWWLEEEHRMKRRSGA
jgi:BNR/Asp-box repeat protein